MANQKCRIEKIYALLSFANTQRSSVNDDFILPIHSGVKIRICMYSIRDKFLKNLGKFVDLG